MMTNLPKRARIAGLVALSLTLFAIAALPAEARTLSSISEIGTEGGSDVSSGKGDSNYCLSRQDVKYEFKQQYHLQNVDVSRTQDRYIYKVTGYGKKLQEEAAALSPSLLRESSDMSSSKKVRYVFIFDACYDRIVKQLQPSMPM